MVGEADNKHRNKYEICQVMVRAVNKAESKEQQREEVLG